MRDYPRDTWGNHLANLDFRQGEHIFVSGPTSAGKTTLIRGPLEKRKYVVCLFTKMKDPTIKREYQGYKRFDRWPRHGFNPQTEQRVMIWPKPEKTMRGTISKQKEIMAEALDRVAHDGSWCVMLDEMLYMVEPRYLNLGAQIGMLHYYGRSSKVSAIALAQRPFHVPRIVLSSATHAYFARTFDAGDQKRLSELGSIDPREVVYNMKHSITDRHDFLYLNPQGDAPSTVVNTHK